MRPGLQRQSQGAARARSAGNTGRHRGREHDGDPVVPRVSYGENRNGVVSHAPPAPPAQALTITTATTAAGDRFRIPSAVPERIDVLDRFQKRATPLPLLEMGVIFLSLLVVVSQIVIASI